MYLLDTDICSYLMDARNSILREKLRSVPPEELAISVVTHAEIWYGLAWKDVGLRRRLEVQAFFESIPVLDWPSAAAPRYGELRARLRKAGIDIGLNDTMIAAHAIAIDAILVTNNTRHYSRIGPPLRIENWMESHKETP